MGLFSSPSSPLDHHIDRATSDKNTSEDWAVILDVCDHVKDLSDGPKDCIRILTKKLSSDNPRVALQATTLLDACVNNCGKNFLLEVASRDFEQELRKLITSTRTHNKVSVRLRECLKQWAVGEFKEDRQLSLIPALYTKLLDEGVDFSSSSEEPKKKQEYSNDPNVVNNKQEEDDIAKAIEMSLQSSGGTGGSGGNVSSPYNISGGSSLYPSDLASALDGMTLNDSKGRASPPPLVAEEPRKARALYDFEAEDDNELTFNAGEIVVVLDGTDRNWWRGSNHRGEGLFPANFVTLSINGEPDPTTSSTRAEKRVSFSECVEVTEVEDHVEDSSTTSEPTVGGEVTGEVDEEKIDYLIHLLHEADPTGQRPDDANLPLVEEQVAAMAPTIDAELEQIDRRHNELTQLSADLMQGLNLYHQLMREMPVTDYYATSAHDPTSGGHPSPLHHPAAGTHPLGAHSQYGQMYMMTGQQPPPGHGHPMGAYSVMGLPGMNPSSLPPNTMGPNSMPPNTIVSNTLPPNSMPPHIVSNAMPHSGMPSNIPHGGMPPSGMPTGGMPLDGLVGGSGMPPQTTAMYQSPLPPPAAPIMTAAHLSEESGSGGGAIQSVMPSQQPQPVQQQHAYPTPFPYQPAPPHLQAFQQPL